MLTVLIANADKSERSVNLQVYVNESLLVNGCFTCSGVSPSYEPYMFKLKDDCYRFKVIKDGRQLLLDNIDLQRNLFIYVTYLKNKAGEEKMYIRKIAEN